MGEHRGAVAVSVEGGPTRAIPVLLIVTPRASGPQQGVVECAAGGILPNLSSPAPNFSARAGDPLAVEVEVRNRCGGPVENESPSLEFSNMDSPVALVNVGGGRYVGTWVPQAWGAQITAHVRLSGPSSAFVRRGRNSSGVGKWARGTRGNPDNNMGVSN